MKQAVKSALGLGTAAAVAPAPLGVQGGIGTQGFSAYGPTIGTIPVTQTVTVPTMVDTVETIQQPIVRETTTVQKQVIPAIVEHREVAPVIHQRIRQEEVEEIQPIIHREREKTEIHKILQPMYTTSTMGVAAEERTLAAQVRPEIRLQGALPPASLLPTTQYESAQRVRVDKAPIVMETERKKIIEEVQPVVYKEVIQPHVIHLTQPIYEKIVEADIYVERILPATTFVTPAVATVSTVQQVAPVVQQVAPISATSVNIAEPTSAFTQTYDITTPVNAPGITANRIEGVSQGMQVGSVGVAVQPLPAQSSLGIQQPFQSFSSSSIQPLQQQQFLGAQSSLLGSQGGLAQPGFASTMQQPSSLGMQPGFSQSTLGLQQPGFGYQQGLAQQGFAQQGFAQQGLGMQQPFVQSGFQQPLAQPGLAPSSLGYGQQGLAPSSLGYGQQGLASSSMGYGQQGLAPSSTTGYGQQGGFTQGLATGLGQQMGQQLGSSMGGLSKGLGGVTGGLGNTLATAF